MRKSRGRSLDLVTDLTPLIDVVFLLLIFFMVSTVFKADDYALGLSLPKSEAGKQDKKKIKEPVTIELSVDSIAFNGNKTDFDEIGDLLRPVEKTKVIQLRVSKDVAYQRLVDLLDLLHQNKLSNISLITEKEK